MSEKNGKVCCNCKHNIRKGKIPNITCHCEIDGDRYLSYLTVMTGWCKHWAADRFEQIRRLRNEKHKYVSRD